MHGRRCQKLIKMLDDPKLQNTYLIIDALDECIVDSHLLLQLVTDISTAHSHVKLIVSSRNWPSIEQRLNKAEPKVKLHLELNETSVSAAVTAYIHSKVGWLAERNEYDGDTQNLIQNYLSLNAKGTFLWVALVCQEIANIPGWEVEDLLTAFPPGLEALYKRMMDQICSSRNDKLCKSILAILSVVYRPITLDELTAFIDFPLRISSNRKALAEIIGRCGSFLTLREYTVSFVHQSAKDFLVGKAYDVVFLSGIDEVQYNIFSRSLQVMSKTLQRDIYNLGHPGYHIEQVEAA